MGFATGLGHGIEIGNGSTLRQNGIEPDKKTFGEMFGTATGVSDPRLQKIPIRNDGAGGKAATGTGYDDPDFHTWPPGHINQNPFTKRLLRIRSSTKKHVRCHDLCDVPSERGSALPGIFPELPSGLVNRAPSAPLTDEVGSVLDWEVYFTTRAN